MPTYVYRCGHCGRVEEAVREVEARDEAPVCIHAGRPRPGEPRPMRRVVGAGVFVTPDPYHLRELNRWPSGMSEQDKTETRKRWDREYDEGWDGAEPSREDYAVKPMVETFAGLREDDVVSAAASGAAE